MSEKPGVKITMGGQEWFVPSMTLRQLRDHASEIELIKEARLGFLLSPDEIDAVCKVTAAALSRNYPDMTAEKLADMIDLANVAEVVNAVMTGAGLVSVGEAAPVASALASENGSMPSSALSLPGAAGN